MNELPKLGSHEFTECVPAMTKKAVKYLNKISPSERNPEIDIYYYIEYVTLNSNC